MIGYLKGDVWIPDPIQAAKWPYCIECKHYKEVPLHNLLTAKSSEIWQFWKQAVDAAEAMDKKPLVIFRWDRSKDFVVWDDEIEVDTQMNVRAFGYDIKIAELANWLPKVKLK